MKYVYPATFTQQDGIYLVDFPDLEGCFTDGETIQDAISNAEDVLGLYLWNMAEEKRTYPTPSPVETVPVPTKGFVNLIVADPIAYKKRHDTKAVRKTLTIPAWLDTLALSQNINFSQTLQNALIKELHVER